MKKNTWANLVMVDKEGFVVTKFDAEGNCVFDYTGLYNNFKKKESVNAEEA